MEHAISDFDRWLDSIETQAQGLQLVPTLDFIASSAGVNFGLHIWFVEILGRRWSYIAGEVRDTPSESEIVRIPLKNDFALVANGWGTLSEPQRDKFVVFVTHLISDKHIHENTSSG